MLHPSRSRLVTGCVSVALLVTGIIGGCANTREQSANPTAASGGTRPDGEDGLAADASAEQIYRKKCQFCHGQNGNGGGAPALTAAASRPDAEIRKVIHDGDGKMPAFSRQLTAEQIDAMVNYVKGLGKG